jgi:hypothetical protein
MEMLTNLFKRRAQPESPAVSVAPIQAQPPSSKCTDHSLVHALKEHFAPILRAQGFKGSGQTFRRVSGDCLQVINVQRDKYGYSEFYLNVAVHPLAIPDARGRPADPRKMYDYDCEFRTRLGPSGADSSWRYEWSKVSMDSAVAAAASRCVEEGLPLLERMSGANSPLDTYRPEHLGEIESDILGFSALSVRMSLVIARYRLASGRVAEAREFAQAGLERLGAASGLKDELEQLAAAP